MTAVVEQPIKDGEGKPEEEAVSGTESEDEQSPAEGEEIDAATKEAQSKASLYNKFSFVTYCIYL